MLKRRPLVALAVPWALLFNAAPTSAQSFPSKPIRLYTAEAGGGLDFTARVIATPLGAAFGRPVVVSNHGAGSFAAEIVACSMPRSRPATSRF